MKSHLFITNKILNLIYKYDLNQTNCRTQETGYETKGITTKYKEWDVIKEHADRTSELYAPLMRHGKHPKRFHQVIDDHLRRYRAQFIGKLSYQTIYLYCLFLLRTQLTGF